MVEGISEKMLVQQLRELEADGLVSRKVFHQVPPKVEYATSRLGASLTATLAPLAGWGEAFARRRARQIA